MELKRFNYQEDILQVLKKSSDFIIEQVSATDSHYINLVARNYIGMAFIFMAPPERY